MQELRKIQERTKAVESELNGLEKSVSERASAHTGACAKAMLNGDKPPVECKTIAADRKRIDELRAIVPIMKTEFTSKLSELKAQQFKRWNDVADNVEAAANQRANAKFPEVIAKLRELAVIIGEVNVLGQLDEKGILRQLFIQSLEDPNSFDIGMTGVPDQIRNDLRRIEAHGCSLESLEALETDYAVLEKAN